MTKKDTNIASNSESIDTEPASYRRSAADLRGGREQASRPGAPEIAGLWKRRSDRANPLDILRASDAGRQAQLLPIRYGRMLQTPFTFYRGSAAVMAADLAKTSTTGIRVQACGDCHLLNFGGFATPERNILLDINDFDETLPAPWEWDVNAWSAFVLAASQRWRCRHRWPRCGIACARSYREHMREYAQVTRSRVDARASMRITLFRWHQKSAWGREPGSGSPRRKPGRIGTRTIG